jgi:hypothetical protein
MSSASIMVQIGVCEAQISACKRDIKKKQEEIDDKESAKNIFLRKEEGFYKGVSQLETEQSNLSAVNGRVKTAKAFTGKADFYAQQKHTQINKIGHIRDMMKKEIQLNIDEESQLQAKLRSLQGQLSGLQNAYHDEVRRENEAAAAALLSGK